MRLGIYIRMTIDHSCTESSTESFPDLSRHSDPGFTGVKADGFVRGSSGQRGGFLFTEASCRKLVLEYREGDRLLKASESSALCSGLSAGQQYSDSFAQVNPLRKVPALKDGDFLLAER